MRSTQNKVPELQQEQNSFFTMTKLPQKR